MVKEYRDSFPFGANISTQEGRAVAKKAAAKKRGPNSDVSAETFIKEYAKAKKAGKTIEEFSKEIKLTPANIQARKQNYQKKYELTFGSLKRPSKTPQLDTSKVKELQKLLDG